MRLLAMRYFNWEVPDFERVWNPGNCDVWVWERDNQRGAPWHQYAFKNPQVLRYGADGSEPVPPRLLEGGHRLH